MLGTIYTTLGILIAWVIRQIFWVPHRFRYGILVAGGWANYGDIPTSVMLSITAGAPFGGSNDQNLAVAYISALLLFWTVTFFPCGAHRWIAMDFIGPDVENEEVRQQIRLKHRRIVRGCVYWTRKPSRPDQESGSEIKSQVVPSSSTHNSSAIKEANTNYTKSTLSAAVSAADTQAMTAIEEHERTPPPVHNYLKAARAWLRTLALQLSTPPSAAVLVSFTIAVIPKVKALFLTVDGVYMPTAPDGQPPLAFLFDTATFVGAASVPLGLICLGSALARMSVPLNKWQELPLGAILSLAAAKMVVFPPLGVLITRGLVKCGIIDADDRVLVFICIFFACLPTATTQVYMTMAYNPTGSAEHISAFLIPQYVLMMISMICLNVYTLHTLF